MHKLTSLFRGLLIVISKQSDKKTNEEHSFENESVDVDDIEHTLLIVVMAIKDACKREKIATVEQKSRGVTKNQKLSTSTIVLQIESHAEPIQPTLKKAHHFSLFVDLPTEIIQRILSFVEYQRDLAQLTLVHPKISQCAFHFLYLSPMLQYPTQLKSLLHLPRTNSFLAKECIKKLTFVPCPAGTLNASSFYESTELNSFYSLFFHRILQDSCQDSLLNALMSDTDGNPSFIKTGQSSTITTDANIRHGVEINGRYYERCKVPMPHPFLFALMSAFPALASIQESRVGLTFDKADEPDRKFTSVPYATKPFMAVSNSTYDHLRLTLASKSIEEGSYTNSLLHSLFSSSKQLHTLLHRLGLDFSDYLSVILSLLKIANQPLQFRTEFQLAFANIQFQSRKDLSLLAKKLLERWASAVMDQIKYMTFCSQRLLDCFSMVHYRIFSLSRKVDLTFFSDSIMDLNHSNVPKEISGYSQNGLEYVNTARDDLQKAKECIQMALSVVQRCFQRENLDLKCAQFYRLSPTTITASCLDSESVDTILSLFSQSDELLSFLFSSIMSKNTISESLVPDLKRSEDIEQLKATKSWIEELCHWHKISKQLDTVRFALKESLVELEFFKGIQEEHQMSFIR